MILSRTARTAALCAAFAGLSLGTAALSPAQDKAPPKAGKKVLGTIEIGQGKDDKFRFFVRNDDGKLLAMSGPGGYETKAEAEKGIEELRAVMNSVTKIGTQKKKDKDDDKDDMPPKKDKKGGKDKDEMEKDNAPKKKKPE